jgi:hypothetical protein
MKVNFASYESSAKDLERSGSLYSVFNFPKDLGLKEHKTDVPKQGDKKWSVDFLPYHASANHPLVVQGKIAEGDAVLGMDYWVHKDVGDNKKALICPRLTFGEKECPICALAKKLYSAGNEDAYKAIKAKRYSIFHIYNYETGEYEYFNITHFGFTKPLMAQAMALFDEATGTGAVDFADPAKGKTVVISLGGKPWGTGKGMAADWKAFAFKDRDYDFTETCEGLIPFENYLNDYSLAAINKELNGAIAGDEEWTEEETAPPPPVRKPSPAAKKAPAPIVEEEPEVEEEIVEETVEEVEDETEQEVEEEIPEPPPARKPAPGGARPASPPAAKPSPSKAPVGAPAKAPPTTPKAPPAKASPAPVGKGAPPSKPGAPAGKPGGYTPPSAKPGIPSMPAKHANNSKMNEVAAQRTGNEKAAGFECPARGNIGEDCDCFVTCNTCEHWDKCTELQRKLAEKKKGG